MSENHPSADPRQTRRPDKHVDGSSDRDTGEAARSASESSLRDSETRFRELADNISQFAWTADESGWIYWYNKRWHDYTGAILEEMQGWGWQKVHHPNHVDR